MTLNFVMMHSNTSNIILYHRQQVKQSVHCICVSVCVAQHVATIGSGATAPAHVCYVRLGRQTILLIQFHSNCVCGCIIQLQLKP